MPTTVFIAYASQPGGVGTTIEHNILARLAQVLRLPEGTRFTVNAPVAPAPLAGSSVTSFGAAPTMATRACPSCRGAVPVGDKFCVRRRLMASDEEWAVVETW